MKLKHILGATLLVSAAVLTTGASKGWNQTVERTDGGHVIGNPDAELKITEFISYTCPHCATFAREGEAPLQIAYIGSGKGSLEVRHLILNQVDLTAAMLAWCGDKDNFPGNHTAFMLKQDVWLGEARKASAGQTARWQNENLRERNRAIATDLKFYTIMEGRGYSRVETEECLADTAIGEQLMDNTTRNMEVHGVQGTPSFLLNGTLLDATHSWSALEPKLNEAYLALNKD